MAPLTKEQEEMLSNAYYKQKHYVGRDKLYNLLKNQENSPSKVQVMEWLSKQEIYQLHYKPRKSSSIAPIIIKKPNIYYQADLIDMGNDAAYNKRYIFTLIDSFTKQAFAVAMTKKNEASILKAFERIYNKILESKKSIKVLQTDNGAEFINKNFEDFLKNHNIKHLTSIAGRPQSNGIIERFNGTLKDYIQKDITATGKNEWPKNLHIYIDNYNNSYHSTIKMTPNEASSNIDKTLNNIRNKAIKEKLITISKLAVGDKVRVKIFKGKLEKSSKKNFGKSIYIIHNIIKSSKPFIQIKYRLKDKNGNLVKNFYTNNDLLKVVSVNLSPVLREIVKSKNNNSKTSRTVIAHKPITRSQTKNL